MYTKIDFEIWLLGLVNFVFVIKETPSLNTEEEVEERRDIRLSN